MQNQAVSGPAQGETREHLQSEERAIRRLPAQPETTVPGYRRGGTGRLRAAGPPEELLPGGPASYFPVFHAPAVLRDARGCTYQAVRSCDLDRICDK